MPETVVCERADDAMDAIRRMLASGGEVIIKPIFGSMGHGLVRVADPELAWRVVRPLEQMRSVFYVQRAIDHGGRDIRLFVVGGRVVGAIERTAPLATGARTSPAVGPRGRSSRPAEWQRLRACARRAPSAPTMPASTCSSRAPARCSCWK